MIEIETLQTAGACTSCHQRAPLAMIKAGVDFKTVIGVCPKCQIDLLTKLAKVGACGDAAGLQSTITELEGEYAGVLEKASNLGELLHDVIERLRNALGGVVAALHDGEPINAAALESVLDSTRRLLTGDITNRPA